jgi:nucleoside-diphosphate-sugar epimerase
MEADAMRVLLTGATGFIGGRLAEKLTHRGDEVTCLVRDVRRPGYLDPEAVTLAPWTRLAETLDAHEFHYVIHGAGATRALRYKDYHAANVDLTVTLLTALAESPHRSALRKFVLVGSQAAMGPTPPDGPPVTEDAPARPVNDYGRSKLEGELAAWGFGDRLPVTIVRPAIVFGPRDKDVLAVFQMSACGILPTLRGEDRLVSVIYVDDLVDLIILAAEHPGAIGRTYLAANPDPINWREFCCLVGETLGRTLIDTPIPAWVMRASAVAGDIVGRAVGRAQLLRTEKFVEMLQPSWACNPQRAISELGWTPKTPLREAVRATADWYIRHGMLRATLRRS